MTTSAGEPGGAVARLRISAVYLGSRLELRGFSGHEVVSWTPLLIRAGRGGWAALFRYGVVVSFGLTPEEASALIEELEPLVTGAASVRETEHVTAVVDPSQEEHVDPGGVVWLRGTEADRLQVVGEALAKSTALAHYESEVGRVFDRIEPLAERVARGLRATRGSRPLLRQLGEALVTQARIIGRLEVEEKPDVTWEKPALDRLYVRLASEYELAERNRILSRKTNFVSDSIGLLIGMVQQQQSLRLEWYIVVLIVVEILLVLAGR